MTGGTGALAWLLESDPSIRWQALRDLGDADGSPVDIATIEAERERVAHEGWGARLLGLQRADGSWDGGGCFPGEWDSQAQLPQPWTATLPTLALLRRLGVDPSDPVVERAIEATQAVRWEYDDLPFWDGEVEPCINGQTVAIGAYFGVDVTPIVDRLLGERLDDGGWNCEVENGATVSSFHTIINVAEGLVQYLGSGLPGVEARRQSVELALAGAHEYMLSRRLMFRLTTGQLAHDSFTSFRFPPQWHYDVLRALDHFRAAGVAPETRMDEALAVVRAKAGADGRWPLERVHPGKAHFAMEEPEGAPSRWNTLRALRVLRWAEAGKH